MSAPVREPDAAAGPAGLIDATMDLRRNPDGTLALRIELGDPRGVARGGALLEIGVSAGDAAMLGLDGAHGVVPCCVGFRRGT